MSVVPVNVYGYAALVAYSLHHIRRAGRRPIASLVSPSFANPLVSMVIGALSGFAADQLT